MDIFKPLMCVRKKLFKNAIMTVLKELWGTSACILSCKSVNLCFIWNGSIVYRVLQIIEDK